MSDVLDRNDQDRLSDEYNPAEERERQQVDPSYTPSDDDFDGITGGDNYAKEGRSGDLGGGRKPINAGRKGKSEDDDGIKRNTVADKPQEEASGRFGAAKQKAQAVNSKYKGLKGKAGKLLKNKWLMGLGASGVFVVGVIIVMIFIFMQAFKVPHLMQNITSYQFARITEHAAFQNKRTIRSWVGVKLADTETASKLKAKYGETYDHLTSWTPNSQMKNLQASGTTFNTDGSGKLLSVTINDKQVFKPQASFGKKLIPGYKFASDVKFANSFVPELNGALRANDAGMIIRGVVGERYRKAAGISFVAWKLGQYSGKSSKEVARDVFRDNAKAAAVEEPNTAISGDVHEAVDKVNEARTTALANDTDVDYAVEHGGILKPVQDELVKTTEGSLFKSGLSIVNPLYGFFMPVCIIYDGSIDKSGGTMDANSMGAIKDYNHGATVASQTMDGTTANADIVHGYSDRYGSLRGAAPLATASGQIPNTAGTQTPLIGTANVFTAFDLLGDNATSHAFDHIANRTCPYVTDTKGAIVLGGLNIALTIATLGGESAATESGGRIATKIVEDSAEKAVSRFALSNITSQTGRAAQFLGKQITISAGIAALTLLTRMVVANRSHVLIGDGTSRGNDAVNTANLGANLESGELYREQYDAAPLSPADVQKSNAKAVAIVRERNGQKSAFQRYLALSNPQSLVSKVGDASYNTLSNSPVASVINDSKSLFSLHFYSSTLSRLVNPIASADTDSNALVAGYGNVQWGWTDEENALAQQDDYESLENQRILAASGQEQTIADTYGKCFDAKTTQGTLLAGGMIALDANGNVLNDPDNDPTNDKGLCSPNNLGPHNPRFQQLVFRWRVAQADRQDIDEKVNMQTVTADSSDNAITATEGGAYSVASYNFCQDTNHGCPYAGVKTRLISDMILGKSKAPPLDIIGAQEVSQPTQSGVLAALPGYQSYPTTVPPDQGRAVIWNTAKFTMTGSGGLGSDQFGTIYSNDGSRTPSDGDQRAFPWVKLTSATGENLMVISTHSPNGGDGVGPDPSGSKRETNAHTILAWAKQMSSDGTTVIVTGDFNVSGTRLGNISPYCVLTSDGSLQHVHDLQDGHPKSATCPGPGYYAPLDSIYISTNAKETASGWDWLGDHSKNANTTGSDHSPSYITLTPPAPVGTDTPVVGGSFVGNDGFGGGTCVAYVEYILGRHSSKYHGQVDITTGYQGIAAYTIADNLGSLLGYRVDHTPAVHATVSFPTNLANPEYGHVAIVGQVNADGSIVVEESNWANHYAYGTHAVSSAEAKQLTYAHTEDGWH